MNCDQVFMILTRGPFPTGEPWDEQVEYHLETCADCWRLAEALRPALEVFQEAVPPAESRDLPGYWGDARPASTVVAQLSAAAARTALVGGMRRAPRPYRSYQRDPFGSSLGGDTFRVLILASTFTAAVVSLVLLWRG